MFKVIEKYIDYLITILQSSDLTNQLVYIQQSDVLHIHSNNLKTIQKIINN